MSEFSKSNPNNENIGSHRLETVARQILLLLALHLEAAWFALPATIRTDCHKFTAPEGHQFARYTTRHQRH